MTHGAFTTLIIDLISKQTSGIRPSSEFQGVGAKNIQYACIKIKRDHTVYLLHLFSASINLGNKRNPAYGESIILRVILEAPCNELEENQITLQQIKSNAILQDSEKSLQPLQTCGFSNHLLLLLIFHLHDF